MSKNLTKYVGDVKIAVFYAKRGHYDVIMSIAGTYIGAAVFTTTNKAKASAVADYLSTLNRPLLKEMITEKRKEIKAG